MKVKINRNVGGNPEGSTIEVCYASGNMIVQNGWGVEVVEEKAIEKAPKNKAVTKVPKNKAIGKAPKNK